MCYINKQALPFLFCLANPVALSSNHMLCIFFLFSPKCYVRHDILMSALWSNLHISNPSSITKDIPQGHCSHFSPSGVMQVINGCQLHWSLRDVLGKQQILCLRVVRQTWDRSHSSVRWLCDCGAEMVLIRGQKAIWQRYTLSNPRWNLTLINMAECNLLCWWSVLVQDGEVEHGRWFIVTKTKLNGGKEELKEGTAWDR